MKLSKEVKIGFVVTLSLVIFFAGFTFLKGSTLFSNNKEYICFFNNIDGLQSSSTVLIRGMNVGHVARTELNGAKDVKVVITVGKKVEIPEGTRAVLAQSDLLGSKVIKLSPGPGPAMLENGATLATGIDGGAIESISSELTPRLTELKQTISSLNATLANVNAVMGEDNQKAIAMAIQSIKTTADNLAGLTGAINKESGQISSILRNANSVTGNLARSNDTVQQILSHMNTITRQIAAAPLQKTLTDMQGAITQLKAIMTKVNSNEGSLGLLINNKDMYNNLNSSLQSMTNLMTDLKAHPGKYINVSVFGKQRP